MNTYNLIGRLGSDAEVKELPKSKVLSFRIAIDRGYYSKEKKEYVQATEWLTINKFFDKENAVNIVKALKKGALVYVSGIPKAEAWTDNQGQLQTAISVTGREINILATAKIESTSESDLPY